MSQKRKAAETDPVPREICDDSKNLASTNSRASEPTEGKTKRIKTSPNYQGAPKSNEEASHKKDNEHKIVPTVENNAGTTVTDIKGNKNHPSKPAARRKYCGSERRADLAESRDEERKRASAAEAKNEKLKVKNQELLSRLEQQKGRVTSLEISQLGSGRCGSFFQDDDTIQGNVNLLFELISDWALDWAHGPGDYLMLQMTEADVSATINILQGHTEYLKSRVLRESADKKCAWVTAGCRLAVEAFLANEIARMILARPFNVPLRRSTGGQTNMERYTDRVRDGMKQKQIETHLWTSMTLRAHYSPNQYADSIVEPIINDHLQEVRLEMYHSAISGWMLHADSPLKPLLKTCQGDELQDRITTLIQILHAASKLSLQLWVQNSKVEVVDFMRSKENMLHQYDPRRANLHSLMPRFVEAKRLYGEEIDLLVWPCIKVTKFDPVSLGKTRIVSTKASIVICSTDRCRVNKAELEKKTKDALSQDPVQSSIPQREQEETKDPVDEQDVGLPQDRPNDNVDVTSEDLHQLIKESAGTAAKTTQKDLAVDVLMAESDEATANRPNAEGFHTTRSQDSPRTVIDLTDESETQPDAEKCQESQEPASQAGPQNEKTSNIVARIEHLLPGVTQAAFMSTEPESSRSEEFQTSTQTPTQTRARSPQAGSAGESEHNQAEPRAREQLKSGAASRSSSVEPRQSQIQEEHTRLASMYQFVDIDPAIEEFNEPLNMEAFGNDAENHQEIGRLESLTRNMTRGRSVDGCTSDPIDPMNADNHDDDTIMVVIPPEPATPAENPKEEANNDAKASPQDTMHVDKETETKDIDMNEREDGDSGPAEPAVDRVDDGEGQGSTCEPTESTTEDTIQISKGIEET